MSQIATQDVACILCGTSETKSLICRTRDFCYETCDNEFDYVECKGCGHVYLKNRPALSELGTIYPGNYLAYNYEEQLGGLINSLRARVQKTKVGPVRRHARPGDVIVDVGSGTGDFLALVKAFGDPSWKLVGVDFSEIAVAGLRARGFEGLRGRFEDCAWPLPPAGVIVMNQLIEHVEDPRASLRKAYELLRPGGAVIIETPNLRSWDATLFRQRYWGGWHAPRHWNLFDAASLTRLGASVGFEVRDFAYTLNPFGWLHSVQYLLRERYGWERLGRMFDVDRLLMLCWASGLDVVQKLLTGRTSNMRIVFAKPA